MNFKNSTAWYDKELSFLIFFQILNNSKKYRLFISDPAYINGEKENNLQVGIHRYKIIHTQEKKK